MKRVQLLLLASLLLMSYHGMSQATLPDISVTNYSGKIIINWKNNYTIPIANISIQRSYDSLKNYTTIGAVLNPQSIENGYADNDAPYNKMYYRVFIAFEGGSYIISKVARPLKTLGSSTDSLSTIRYPWLIDTRTDPVFQPPPIPVKSNAYSPSVRIYTARDNNVVIHLPDAATKKYSAIFFTDTEKKLFELQNLQEEYLIIEKVNFGKAGWFNFELYESGKLVEKNKFLIPKDGKITNGGNR